MTLQKICSKKCKNGLNDISKIIQNGSRVCKKNLNISKILIGFVNMGVEHF